jgi:hypothetical protein
LILLHYLNITSLIYFFSLFKKQEAEQHTLETGRRIADEHNGKRKYLRGAAGANR